MGIKIITDKNISDLADAMIKAIGDTVKSEGINKDSPMTIGTAIYKSIQDYLTDKTVLTGSYEGSFTEGGAPDVIPLYEATVKVFDPKLIVPCEIVTDEKYPYIKSWGDDKIGGNIYNNILIGPSKNLEPELDPSYDLNKAFTSFLKILFDQDKLAKKYKDAKKGELQKDCMMVLSECILNGVGSAYELSYFSKRKTPGDAPVVISVGKSIITQISFL
jgi:hypothetical protein